MQRRVSISSRKSMRTSNRKDGSVILDLGSIWTKVVVAGDNAVRAVMRTPDTISSLIHASREASEIEAALSGWLTSCAVRVPELLCCSTTILTNCCANPVFIGVLVRWLKCASGSAPGIMNIQLAAAASFGLTNAVVLDMGWYSTRIVAVIGGVVESGSIQVSKVGYLHILTALRRQIVGESQLLTDGKLDPQLLTNDVLHQFMSTYGVVPPYNSSADVVQKQVYPLPLKTTVLFGRPCQVLENCLFTDDTEHISLPQLILALLDSCHPILERPVLTQICFCGGLAALPNLTRRVKKELEVNNIQDSHIIVEKVKAHGCSLCAVLGGAACVLL